MIEGIVVCVLLLLALIGLHLWNKPKSVKIAPTTIDGLPEVKASTPVPLFKEARKEAQRYERMREEVAKASVERPRQPAVSSKYAYPYGATQRHDRDDFTDTDSALMGVVAAAAAVVVAETIYETVVDTPSSYQYTEPTPSSYEATSSNYSDSTSYSE